MRPIWQIAQDIERDWAKPSYSAKPYLNAMRDLESLSDMYLYDSAISVVSYFLANASAWRGDKAKAVKAELKQGLEEYRNAK